jgi:Fic family protein
MNNRAGKLVNNPAINTETEYKSFKPNPLPPNPPLEIDNETSDFLAKASRTIEKLNSKSEYIPSVKLFISSYVRKEALLSSQIEGTQCTLEDILNPYVSGKNKDDKEEVINYIEALNYAIEELKNLPLCNRLLKMTHSKLLQGVRGQEKNPGEFRKSQNWIGAKSSAPSHNPIKNAAYVPPNISDMEQALSDFEKFINEDDSYDPLIQIGLIHYQFETIHPFLDGNGRIGRLLIPLFLIQKGLLKEPILYISYFLKKNRIEYYDRMTEIRNKGNYEQWVKFFLKALYDTAGDSLETAEKLISLYEENSIKIDKKDVTLELFNYIQENPTIEISKAAQDLKKSYPTIKKATDKLIDLHILKELSNNKRNKIFCYTDYVDLLKRDTEL